MLPHHSSPAAPRRLVCLPLPAVMVFAVEGNPSFTFALCWGLLGITHQNWEKGPVSFGAGAPAMLIRGQAPSAVGFGVSARPSHFSLTESIAAPLPPQGAWRASCFSPPSSLSAAEPNPRHAPPEAHTPYRLQDRPASSARQLAPNATLTPLPSHPTRRRPTPRSSWGCPCPERSRTPRARGPRRS